jgi:hypothetical protein
MTTRRGFLAGIIAAGTAPAIAKSGILMPVKKIALPFHGMTESGFGYLNTVTGMLAKEISLYTPYDYNYYSRLYSAELAEISRLHGLPLDNPYDHHSAPVHLGLCGLMRDLDNGNPEAESVKKIILANYDSTGVKAS